MTTTEQFKVSKEIVSLMKNDNPQLVDIESEDIQYMVSMLVTDYFATIGRGLARSNNQNEYIIIENNILNKQLSSGLFFRIPLTLQKREKFLQLLVKDLQKYTQKVKNIGKYSVLEKTHEGVVLKNVEKIQKKKNSEYNKATVFEPD